METNKQQIETLKANSFSGRYGGTGTDFKIYFDTVEELKKGIDAVIDCKEYLAKQLIEDNGDYP
jgi:hypothetical protein